jgi:hypothetical protein
MGDVIQLHSGNGAKEQLDQFFAQPFWEHAFAARFGRTELSDTDYMLAWLWEHGYVVVPKNA